LVTLPTFTSRMPRVRPAGQIVTIEVDETTLCVSDHCNYLIKNVLRISRRAVRRHKAYSHATNHKNRLGAVPIT
jgi:hypothetical protein